MKRSKLLHEGKKIMTQLKVLIISEQILFEIIVFRLIRNIAKKT
ncbi:unnamed protein product [Paramecium primaurelia]|uniref:Uncharacterized protein n=1 Tax=Paramecium primaurelia TaxID=5886 RepID=A0A8S1QC36_PARPR|nr:unnamed protein product [Paramecium primaurelia]